MEELQVDELQSRDVISTLSNRVSVREYLDKPVSEETLRTILQAAQRSPTSSNMQTYSIVVVRDQERKNILSELGGNQRQIRECGIFLGICADISRIAKANELHRTKLAKNLETTLVSTVDATLIGMSIATAAESLGLGTCMIGGMRNQPMKVAEVLDFPKGVYLIFGLTIGWPDPKRVKPQKPRLPLDVVIHNETYNHHQSSDALLEYDSALAEHYKEQGRNTPEHAWTGIVSQKCSVPRREHLRSNLTELGFSFE